MSAAVAVGLAMGGGCGPAVNPDGEEARGTSGKGMETMETGGSSSSSGGVTTIDGGVTSIDPSQGDAGPRFDLGDAPRFDLPMYDFGTGVPDCAPDGDPPDCDAVLGPGETLELFCVELLGELTCDAVTEDAFLDAARDCLGCYGFAERIVCEPFPLGEAPCCTWTVVQPGQSCPGRPFLVDGSARVPAVVQRDDWARACHPDLEGLGPSSRKLLASAWAAEGCHEAASVGSFSRFVLQLLALGAPASLVHGAQEAVGEEVEHAKTFFGLAAAYGGVAVGPGTLNVAGALAGASDPVAAAVSVATEGCIAETVSAMQLALAASRVSDTTLRSLLEEVAEQELRHAELAWSALGWMLRDGSDAVRSAVADVFARAQDAVPRAVSISDTLDPETLRASGRLNAQDRLDVAQRALAQCIAPAAAALFVPWTSPSSSTDGFSFGRAARAHA